VRKLFEQLDKVLMALFAAGALAVVFVVYRDDLPTLSKKYQEAAKEASKNPLPESNDPEGYVTVAAIRDGHVTYVRMKRRERDALWRQQGSR
jgi:hypothetical protein